MPRYDGTGPLGQGRMSGFGYGFCGGRQYGRGLRLRNQWAFWESVPRSAMGQQFDLKMLKEQAQELKDQLSDIEEKINFLEKSTGSPA